MTARARAASCSGLHFTGRPVRSPTLLAWLAALLLHLGEDRPVTPPPARCPLRCRACRRLGCPSWCAHLVDKVRYCRWTASPKGGGGPAHQPSARTLNVPVCLLSAVAAQAQPDAAAAAAVAQATATTAWTNSAVPAGKYHLRFKDKCATEGATDTAAAA